MKKTLFFIAAIIWTACSSDHVQERDLPDKGRILIVEATKGQTDTRGLKEDDNTLKASWEQGDEVSVLFNGDYIGTLTPTKYGDAATTLTGSIKDEVDVKGKQLTLIFPGINHDDDNSIRENDSRDYTGQKGTLENIAKYYDYATALVTVKDIEGLTVTTKEAAEFENKQAIVRFTLTDDKGNAIEASRLIIDFYFKSPPEKETTKERIIITPTAPTNKFYAALSGVDGKLVSLAANTYYYTTSEEKTFTNGNFYSITVKMNEPLTLECFDDGPQQCAVSVSHFVKLEYDLDGNNNWTPYPDNESIYLSEGHRISFRGTRATEGDGSSEFMNIQCTGKCYVYGNVMSLLYKDHFATMTDLLYDRTFQNLFMGNEYIFHYDGKDLVLPATTLKRYCYYQMFSGCVNLNYIKCLATDIPADNDCTTDWLKSAGTYISGTHTFVRAEGTIWPEGDSGIPDGWTVTTE